ncbi:Hint domain-containing protein [Thioclava sp. GXIMD4215]|uniref:Hint domain-containing protein n=1 Tax=Thioclava sp. GXIMD4215 TaxID=3131928 RepID=UPI003245872F
MTNTYTLQAWDLSDIAASSSCVFPDSETSSKSAVGQSFTISSDAWVQSISLSDCDDRFSDNDSNQHITQTTTLEGSTYSASSSITPEYRYVVTDSSGNSINVYVFDIGRGTDESGLVSDAPLVPGETYTITKYESCNSSYETPSVHYSDLATYPDEAPDLSDGVVYGTDGNDLIDTAYTGDNDGDMIDNNDGHLDGYTGDADVVVAGAGDDTVFSGAGDDAVWGGDGDDFLDGGAGNDYLSGGAGDDTLVSGAEVDTLSGGTGLDMVDYSASSAGVNVDLVSMTGSAGDAAGDQYDGIDGAFGSAYDDTLTGYDQQSTAGDDSYTNVFYGNAGDDLIDGKGGDDSLYGGADNDTLIGGAGNDYIEGNAGNDSLTGDDGNDTLIGDGGTGTTSGSDVSVDWTQFGSAGCMLASGSSFDMGDVKVTFGFTAQERGAYAKVTNTSEYTESGDGLDANSGLMLYGAGGDCKAGDTSTTTLDFSSDAEGVADAVTNVSFRINDIDYANDTAGYHKDIVTVYAYDADGNELDVTITPAGGATVDGNTVSGGVQDTGSLNASSAQGSALVTVDGNVAKIVIDYDNGGDSDQAIYLSDINATTIVDETEGDDTIEGGAGDDVIEGNGGNDLLSGGDGADSISGGDDRDTIMGGAGDTVDGGAGGDDWDTLDLTGQGAYRLTDVTEDENGNGTNGTVEFLDDDGNVTGSLNYTEIEEIKGDGINLSPDAENDTATVAEDDSVIIDVLGNDSDPQGDTLTVTSASAEHGSVTVNDDGTLTYTPDADYNGDDKITYTIDDGNGNTDSAEVAVSVTPVNDDPVAQDDTASTGYNTPVTVDVLANDTDIDGDTLSISGTPVSEDGSVSVNSDGTLTFTPNEGFSGEATVTYQVSDGQGGLDDATLTVTVGANPKDGIVQGTDGNDTIDYAYTGDPQGDMIDHGDALLPGEVGDDDIVKAGAGDDTVKAGAGNDEVYGGDGNDNLQGNAGDDALYGESGNDVLDGGAGDDTLLGGDGNDTLKGGAGNDLLEGGTGDDSLVGGSENDTLWGGDGNDTLQGADGDDELHGGAGNDSLNGGIDNDTLWGDDGQDSLNGADGDDELHGGADDDLLRGNSGNDTVYGDAGNDELHGGTGDDRLFGGEGNDTIYADEGSDYVEGGDGDDYIDTGKPLVDALPDRGYEGLWSADSDPYDDRDTVLGGAGNDTIFTGDDNDYIEGGDGDDSINAGYDDDTVLGGAGNDSIIAGEGSDYVEGGDGDDTIYGGIGPTSGLDVNLPDTAGDKVTDNGMDTLIGGAGNDVIYGEDDDDSIEGGIGDDYLDGGVDDDTLKGDEGNDTLIGGQGNDLLEGGAGDDLLEGGTGTDTVSGGDGNDTIIGGGDNDVLQGNAGRDLFKITPISTTGNYNITVDGGSDGDDWDTLDYSGMIAAGYEVQSIVKNPEYNGNPGFNGQITFYNPTTHSYANVNFYDIEELVPCFTPGTLIATPRGEKLVEELVVGDKVITRDNGIQEIRWVGRRDLTKAELDAAVHLKPVLIRAGALGPNLPERDMMVSPNHRMLVANAKTSLFFEEHEVFVSAKHMAGMEGVATVETLGTSYLHFMFDRHEVVLGNGAWTESFQPGDQTLGSMGNAQRDEIFEIFPELKTHKGLEDYQSARKSLKRHEAELLKRA